MTVEQVIKQELERCIDEIERNIKASGSGISNEDLNSFEIVASDSGGQLWASDNVEAVESGRKPGKTPPNMKQLIIEWAKRKGIEFENNSDVNRFAFFVAQKIEKEGDLLYKAGGRIDIITPAINAAIERITERIQEVYLEKIEEEILKD